MFLSSHAIQYTLSHLLHVAFPQEVAKIQIQNDDISTTIGGITCHFNVMPLNDCELLKKHQLIFKEYITLFEQKVPIYIPSPHTTLFDIQQQSITFHCDLITLPFVLLSRIEELWPGAHFDKHERFCYEGSLSQFYQCIDYPIVDYYALWLRQTILTSFPNITVIPRQSQTISTHDIDILTRFGSPWKNLRTLLADLLKLRNLPIFCTSWKQYLRWKQCPIDDPYILAIKMLQQYDHDNHFQSLFFFKSLIEGERDCTYSIFSEEAANIIDDITSKEGIVGLHGSYESSIEADAFYREKIRLQQVCKHSVLFHRQHYLRFTCQKTIAIWDNAHIGHDYTLGFAEREGFRCGTCHPYALYDFHNDRCTAIIEHPLIVMDATLYQYRELKVEDALCIVKKLQNVCRQAEGDFVLLWHSTTVWRQFRPWFEHLFCKIK